MEEVKGALVRQGDGTEIFTPASVNAETLAKREQSMLQGKLWAARQFPRSIETVEARLIHECKRSIFAEKARYSLPRGDKMIVGWTIRFAEQAMRLFGNVEVRTLVVSEDRDLRVLEVQINDFETMVSESRQLPIAKTIERKTLRKGEEPISERRNMTTGEIIYTIAASEADMLAKQNGTISRAKRNLILELVPPDILYGCEQQVFATMTARDKEDPDAWKKRMLEKYAEIGVTPAQLQTYLGIPLSDLANKLAGSKRAELFGLYEAIKSGDTTWAEVSSGKGPAVSETTAPSAPASPPKAAAKPSEPKPANTNAVAPQGAAGSEEFALSLQAMFMAAKSVEELRALARFTKDVSKAMKSSTDAVYSMRMDALQAGGR